MTLNLLAALGVALAIPAAVHARASFSAVEATQKTTEAKLRNLIEPLLEKYCRDDCKLMNVAVTVDLETPDEIAPGFNDMDLKSASQLMPSSGKLKILMNEKLGDKSRENLLSLIQQHLDVLDYPVRVETQAARFPQPAGAAGKVAELRDRVTKDFRDTLNDLFQQFCPGQCMLADYELKTDVVNAEEVQYGSTGEFYEDNGVAIRINGIAGTILVDNELPPEERTNIVEMAKLKTNFLRNVSLTSKSMKFPRPATSLGREIAGRGGNGRGGQGEDGTENSTNRNLASDSKSTSSVTNSTESTLNAKNNNTTTSSNNTTNTNAESNQRQERFERFEKIERVENGDAVQAELQKFKVYGLVFACAIISLLIFLAMASFRPRSNPISTIQRVVQSIASDPVSTSAPSTYREQSSGGSSSGGNEERTALIAKRYEIERLLEELLSVFAQQPKVAKQVFSRVLTEEGVEVTAQYIHLFGESVVMDMLRDPSLQADMNELMEFYAKNPMELEDDEKLELLRKLHNRTVAGKLVVMGSRSSHLFDFLADMDGLQILELIRNESLTVKSIVMTQCDPQKRAAIYAQLDEDTRMKLMSELSRIDYLPRDYITNVANALKRKRRDNPKLNTESLPGSDVLLTLLERTGFDMQSTVIKSLETTNPESARVLKSKLVSVDTLQHLRDGQLLEVVLSLKHDELLQFLKGAPETIRKAIFAKSPKDLVAELEEELTNVSALSREGYQAVERKILNRMKMMASEGILNLVETNDRMFAAGGAGFSDGASMGAPAPAESTQSMTNVKKVAGW